MKHIVIVGIGGFIGCIFRYLLSLNIQNRFLSAFPYGTLGVNMIGCFAIGLIFGFSEKSGLSSEWRLFLATGICGGFTTFSALSLETFGMLRDGQILQAFSYVCVSFLIGISFTFIGFLTVRFF